MAGEPENGLAIGELAERAGVPAPTLRSWETRYGFPRPRRRHRPRGRGRVLRLRRPAPPPARPAAPGRAQEHAARADPGDGGRVLRAGRAGGAVRQLPAPALLPPLP